MYTVLIIDDHPAIGFALKILLEKESEFCVVTSSGDRLLSQIRELDPDVVILDIELYNSDGLAALPRIKQISPHTRVLMLTAQPAALYAQRAREAGADGFVGKLVPLNTVVSLCQLMLAGYQCFPSSVYQTRFDSRDTQALLARFSDRELTVLRQLRAGKSNKEIAAALTLSNKTISTYKARLLEKSGVDNIEVLYDLLNHENPGR